MNPAAISHSPGALDRNKNPGRSANTSEEQKIEERKTVAGQNLPADTENLRAAFKQFNDLSSQLSASYLALESQVTQLNSELLIVNEQRQQEIREKQRVASRLQNLLDLLPGGVVVLDQYGVVRECNPAAVELLGEPLLGEMWLDVIKRCFAPRSDDGHEISLKDGRRISIATRSLDIEPGQIILLTDQTETRELQKQLSRHERLSAMGRMMSSLAHQIRTPLSAAMLYAGHLSESELSKIQVRKFSQKILSRLTHLEQQVNDMLIFVKGDVKLTDTVPVSDLLADIETAMEVALQSAEARCRVINNAGDIEVHCNRQTIVGALLNLINNSLHACGKGCQIVLEAERHRDSVMIAVLDKGPGMDEGLLEQVKHPFFTTKAQGTGLGLAVAKAVARAHQGEFVLQSTPGQGTCAGMLLPIQNLSGPTNPSRNTNQ